MSRTYAHRPFWAWLAVPDACVASHDHRAGRCDLLPLDVWLDVVRAGELVPWRDFSCRWDVDIRRVPPPCSCAMCSGRAERRAERRRDRYRARLDLRRWAPDTDEV